MRASRHVLVLSVIVVTATTLLIGLSLWANQHGVGTLVTPKAGLGSQHAWYMANNVKGIEDLTATPSSEELSFDIARKSTNEPCTVWSKNNQTLTQADLFFECWDGTAHRWHGLQNQTGPDQVTSSATVNEHPSLALDASNVPMIAWQATILDGHGNPTGSAINFVRWNGTTWRGYQGAKDTISVSTADVLPSLAINSSTNRPAIVWTYADAFHEKVLYREWNGSVWKGKQGSAPDQVNAGESQGYCPCDLAVSSFGVPNVVWSTGNSQSPDYNVFYRRWNGSSWRGLEGQGSDDLTYFTTAGSWPSIALNSHGQPAVVWSGYNGQQKYIAYRRWDGSAWNGETGQAIDSVAGGVGVNTFEEPSIQFTSVDVPIVAWSRNDNSPNHYDIEIARYIGGSNWVGLTGATPDRIANDVEEDAAPRLIIDGAGRSLVAWIRGLTPHYDIYYSHWL